MNLNISQRSDNRMVFLPYNGLDGYRLQREPAAHHSPAVASFLDGLVMESDMLLLEDRRHYTYAHARATTGEIFYIGKGCSRRAFDMAKRSSWHKRVVAKHGVEVRIVKQHMTADEAYAHEYNLIKEARNNGLNLVNATDGGLGASGQRHSKATIKKMSSIQKGRIVSFETREKLSVSLKGRMAPNKGKPMSKGQKEKLSKINIGRPAPNKGKPMSEDQKVKLSIANMGKINGPPSKETRIKISNAHKGRTISDVWRAKISSANSGRVATNKGKPMSEDQKVKLSIANTGKVSPKRGIPMSIQQRDLIVMKKKLCKDYCQEFGISSPGKGYCNIPKDHFNEWRAARAA